MGSRELIFVTFKNTKGAIGTIDLCRIFQVPRQQDDAYQAPVEDTPLPCLTSCKPHKLDRTAQRVDDNSTESQKQHHSGSTTTAQQVDNSNIYLSEISASEGDNIIY